MTALLEAAGVARVLPHRYPMLLVDRVTAVEPGVALSARKAVTANEPWYADLLGGDDVDERYPQVLLVESWCQAAGVLAAWDRPNPDVTTGSVMLFGSMAGITFGAPVRPGDVVEHDVRVVRALSDTVICEGESRVDGELVLRVDRVVMALRPASDLVAAVAVPATVPAGAAAVHAGVTP